VHYDLLGLPDNHAILTTNQLHSRQVASYSSFSIENDVLRGSEHPIV
jgi:hypothetical protein